MKAFRSTSPRTRAALAFLLAASPAAAQTGAAADAASANGVSAPTVTISPAAGVGGGTALAPTLTNGLTGAASATSASLSAAPAGAAAAAPGAAAPGAAAPARAAAQASAAAPAEDMPTPSAAEGASPVAATPSAAPSRAVGAPTAAETSAGASHGLTGAAGRVSGAAAVQAAGGDALSVSDALGRVFDAQTAAPALHGADAGSRAGQGRGGATAGNGQSVRGRIAQEVSIANTASPADAPGLYQDAIETARDALPAATAASVAAVVRGFAARKVESSLGGLAAAAYRAAVGGSAKETSRLLSAFDQWETVLGAPGRPLVANADALKSDVRRFLPASDSAADDAASAAAPAATGSIPHVWFRRQGASYVAVLPAASRVAPVPSALALGFALVQAPALILPVDSAYRSFYAAPGASSGASVVYRARRALGSGVPAAALAAARFWLRSLIASLRRRLAELFAPSYDLSRADGRAALKRDALLARTARTAAAAARRALAVERPSVGADRAAFAAAKRAAAAFGRLDGVDASGDLASLSAAFEAATAGSSFSDAPPTAAAALIDGPGGLSHWVALLDTRARRGLSEETRPTSGASLVNLGAESGPAVAAAALARESGAEANVVALDDQLWARGDGPEGRVSLAADLRATADGGSASLTASRGDAALARRLEDLGFSVDVDGGGLRAVLDADGPSRPADEVAFVAARGLALALGRGPAAEPGLEELTASVRRDPRAAAALAQRLDGRAPFSSARVIGMVGDYEALSPVAADVDGRAVLVGALRDPATGLLGYAARLSATRGVSPIPAR
ncbi:MAG: hypothetical protein HKL90_02520 [Elusimicrobia bacterium]|nr:hypothetical protein [Elusimicrobiota bacterium]